MGTRHRRTGILTAKQQKVEGNGNAPIPTASKTVMLPLSRCSVELLIDSVTLVLNNQVRIFASLLADVAVRYPAHSP